MVATRFGSVQLRRQVCAHRDGPPQYRVIDVVKQYERQRGYDRHPIGMTMQFPVPDQRTVSEVLFNSPADWISPGDEAAVVAGDDPADAERPASRWLTDPPENGGAKVVLSDTDHYAAGQGDALWAWKSFLRGHHPILMDIGIINVTTPLDPSLARAGQPLRPVVRKCLDNRKTPAARTGMRRRDRTWWMRWGLSRR